MGYFSFWVAPFHHIIAINKQDEFKAFIELRLLWCYQITILEIFLGIFGGFSFSAILSELMVSGDTVGHVNELLSIETTFLFLFFFLLLFY